jgi:hypothetical protein
MTTTPKRTTRSRTTTTKSPIHAVPPAAMIVSNGEAPAEDITEATKGDVYDNLDRLRSKLPEVRTRQPLTTVPVIKRPSQFFRTNPDPAYTMIVTILEYGPTDMDKETYLVDPALWDVLKGETRDAQLFLVVDLDRNAFIWPVKLPRDEDGRGASWAESALEMADLAKREWIKIKGSKATGTYRPTEAVDDLGEPEWPTDENGSFSFGQLLRKAFGQKHYIDTLDHVVVKKLQGRL